VAFNFKEYFEDAGFGGNGIDNVFIERQLEYVKAKSYDIKYADLIARQLIPVSHETPPGAATVKYNSYDMFALAKVISSYGTDLPRSDVRVTETRQVIQSLGSSYGYNVQELRAAAMAGLPLEQRKANAARRAIEQKFDLIATSGDATNGLQGILTQANAQTYTIPNGQGGFQAWSTKVGLEILADMNLATAQVVTSTNDVEHPTTLAVPLKQFAIISMTPVNTGIPATVLQHFLKSSPWIKEVIPWYRLTGAGAGASDRMLIYVRDPDHLWLEIPQEYEQFPVQPLGLEFRIPCHARCGGVIVPYPLAIIYGDHI
jgi:hypothetical protein